jgi:ribosome biogenesis GTPase A
MVSISKDVVTDQPTTTLCTPQFDTEKEQSPILLRNTSDLLHCNAINELAQSSTVSNTQSEKFCGTSSHKDEESKSSDATNLESNMNNPCPVAPLYVQPTQEELGFSKAKVVSSDDFSSAPRQEILASTYQHVTTEIEKVAVNVTLDPVMRRDISETFNEINILLCGAPRVGKSTLINAICEKQLAKTNAGLGACTNRISSYFLKGNIEIDSEKINYRYNFWDTPGIEKWTQEEIRKTLEILNRSRDPIYYV